MKKKIVVIIITLALLLNFYDSRVCASGMNQDNGENNTKIGEIGGYLAGNINSVIKITAEGKFNIPKTGHGFAAERGNNLIDVLKGLKSSVVGDDNAANGPDRKIINRNGTVTWIQDKYYATATRSVNAAFDESMGMYRYIDSEGKPMQLEVPKDQYDKAVEAMRKKIAEGKVPGVTNQNEAEKIVNQGKLTYKQAVNLTKAGTIESLTYDAVNGVIVASCAMGISFVIDYALCKINGQNNKEALKNASLSGLKSGGIIFATYVISSQLAKTGLKTALAPTTEAVAKSLGKGISEVILRISGEDVAKLTTQQITTKISSILQTQIITTGVLIVVLEASDIINLFRGRISGSQLLQNLVVTVIAVGGTYVGSLVGGAVGTIVLPGGGTLAGAFIGGIIGGAVTGTITKKLLKHFFKSDTDKMYEIVTSKFEEMCFDYVVTEDEANELVDELKNKLADKTLKDMYQSKDREKFAEELMKPMFEKKIASREKIEMPDEEETRHEMLCALEGVVFLH